jgi:hypothetical protein
MQTHPGVYARVHAKADLHAGLQAGAVYSEAASSCFLMIESRLDLREAFARPKRRLASLIEN